MVKFEVDNDEILTVCICVAVLTTILTVCAYNIVVTVRRHDPDLGQGAR